MVTWRYMFQLFDKKYNTNMRVSEVPTVQRSQLQPNEPDGLRVISLLYQNETQHGKKDVVFLKFNAT